MNCGHARKGTCHSRGAHIACTRTYNGQGARKKIRPCMCTYGRGLERLLAHTYDEGSCTWLGQNGETTSSSCSCGANRLGVTPSMRLYLSRVGARLRGITTLWFCRKKGHLHTQGSASGQKKRFAPLTAGTQQLHLRTQGSARQSGPT